MDIHRARFIPHTSPAINSLAFSASTESELSKGGLKNLRLAVGRENGDVEIWNPLKGAWVRERTFHAGTDRSIEAVLWTQEPSEYDGKDIKSTGQLRLFSIGHANAVTEWDLGTGLAIPRETGGNLSTIWCFAAQPRLHPNVARTAAVEGKPLGQDIVVGCEDGSIALLTTADNDLQFSKYIARSQSKTTRALSIAFRDRHTVAVGFSNSTFRIYDIRNSTVIRTVTLGAGQKGGPKRLMVWALKWLPSGDIVTGDSGGEVRFWDAKLFGQYQRIKAHVNDIFSIATNKDGTRVFSAGADRKTSIFQKSFKGKQWNRLSYKYFHEHDVKALAVYDGDKAQKMSFLASGGIDTDLSIVPVENYGEEYHRKITGLPQQPQISSAPNARRVASWEGVKVTIWKVKHTKSHDTITKPIASMTIEGEESITSCALSQDGQFLAVTTAANTQIWEFSELPDPKTDKIKVRRIRRGGKVIGGSSVQISPDQKWLSIITSSNKPVIYRLVAKKKVPRASGTSITLSRPSVEKRGADKSALPSYREAVTHQQFSADSQVLIVSDLSGFMDCWQLEGEEDLSTPDVAMKDEDGASDDSDDSDDEDEAEVRIFGQSWKTMASAQDLPQLDSSALILTFRPGKKVQKALANGITNGDAVTSTEHQDHELTYIPNEKHELFILTANHQLYEFDLSNGKLTDWSRRNPTSHLPETFLKIKDRAMGSYWHTRPIAQRLYLYGNNWVFMFDVEQDLDVPTPTVKEDGGAEENLTGKSNKRKWKGESGAGDKMRREDYKGFEPGVEVTLDGAVAPPLKNTKTETAAGLIKAEGEGEDEDDDETAEEDEEEGVVATSLRINLDKEGGGDEAGELPRKTWHSFAYRPVLAVIGLGERGDALETLLVERPLWEMGLPPRHAGPHEKSSIG